MRLHYGAPPENPEFNPEAEGWRKLAFDPSPILLQLMAIPVIVVLVVIWGRLLFLVPPLKMTSLQVVGSPILVLGWLIILLMLIPVHELLHALMHPHWGRSPNTILGLWLSKGLGYAHYEGEMSRNRYVLAALVPYLILGLLPLGILALPGTALWPAGVVLTLVFLSLPGSVLACGDMVVIGLLLFQIPGAAIVRNKGWKTYWRPVP
ncbi:MAG: DUF3267 domain-containing protein [Chloroflexi bacterium]|nr:MAG: DUF3267 domain-containing protein [Chloroflexota bacterium]